MVVSEKIYGTKQGRLSNDGEAGPWMAVVKRLPVLAPSPFIPCQASGRWAPYPSSWRRISRFL